jgi:DNA-binding response OmpR family regulator
MSEREIPVAAVLYIEDHPVNVRLMRGVFALWPHLHLDSAADGRAALEHIRRRQPDLVVVDGNVVELDGVDVVRQICASATTGDLPVMVISSDGRPARAVELLALGVDEYVVKPFDIGHLGDLIGRLTRTRSATPAPIPAPGAFDAVAARSVLGGI